MKLDDNYRIVRDAHSWNLVSLKNRNKTQYHANLKQALIAYLHLCLKPPVTVQHIIKAISEAEERSQKWLPERAWKKPRRRKARRSVTMNRNEKAGYRLTHGSGSNEKHSTGMSKRFLFPDYRHFSHSVQCQYCGSDYMRFAVNGYCQPCQQRAEYVIRERPATADRAKARGAY
jgi:hypothetical protein